jgi:uncharacterized protein with PQ loop repeat
MLADVTGYVATLFSMAFIWPQVVRAHRRNTVEGLAPLGQVIGSVATVLWGVYSYFTERLPGVVSNINMLLALGCLIAIMVRHRVLKALPPIVAVAAATSISLYVGRISPETVGIAAVIVGTPSILPQFWRALRSNRLYGVSVPSNLIFLACCVTWFVYGILEKDWILIFPNLFVIPCALLITTKAARSHRLLHESASLSV